MEAFENIYDNHYWLSHIVQDSIKCIYEETNFQIKEKISQVLRLLNINEDNTENKFLSRFRTLFQEYFSSVFVFSEQNQLNINNKLKNDIIITYKDLNEEVKKNIFLDLDSKFFTNFCQTVFKLCIYMLLHDPQLTLNIDPYDKRVIKYVYYIKKEHLNIEGFETENSPCIIILFPPMLRNSFSYQGMKPAVYMIHNFNEEIKRECEKNNVKLIKKVNSNEYISFISSKSDKQVEIGENSLHSGNNSSLNNRLIPESAKANYNNVLVEKESPKIKQSKSIKSKNKVLNNNHSNVYVDNQKTNIALDDLASTVHGMIVLIFRFRG